MKHRFAHPYLAYMMFIPSSLVGLLIPRIIWKHFPLSQDVSIVKASKEVFQHIEICLNKFSAINKPVNSVVDFVLLMPFLGEIPPFPLRDAKHSCTSMMSLTKVTFSIKAYQCFRKSDLVYGFE